jgi:alkylhydroperoxidase family enzyme
VEYALKVATDSANVGDGDLDRMRVAGFTDDEIWDIGAITALFALSNRYANFTGMRPNDEFYAMAR